MVTLETQRAEALRVAWYAADAYERATLDGNTKEAKKAKRLERDARAKLRRLHSLQGAGE